MTEAEFESGGVERSSSRRDPKTVTLVPLPQCSTEQQMLVRDIRNHPSVRNSMYSAHEIGADEHLRWVESLGTDKKKRVFAALNENRVPVGVVYLYELDFVHKKTDWGFYLDVNQRGGLGASLEYCMIEYAFDFLGLEKLNCEVIESNESVVKLHKKFGFSQEGFRRHNIERAGKRMGVHFLGLTRQEWLAGKGAIQDRYGSSITKYVIVFEDKDYRLT